MVCTHECVVASRRGVEGKQPLPDRRICVLRVEGGSRR